MVSILTFRQIVQYHQSMFRNSVRKILYTVAEAMLRRIQPKGPSSSKMSKAEVWAVAPVAKCGRRVRSVPRVTCKTISFAAPCDNCQTHRLRRPLNVVNEPWSHKCYALQRKQARTTVLLYSIQKVEVGRTYCASAIVLTSSVRIGRSNAMGMAQRALAAASAPTATTASTAKCVSLVHLPHLFQSITLRHRENPWSGELASHLFVSRF